MHIGGNGKPGHGDSFFEKKKNTLIPENSVQLVITSPPYSGAQKYIRSTSLNIGWLGFCAASELRTYKKATIGREEYHKDEYEKYVGRTMRLLEQDAGVEDIMACVEWAVRERMGLDLDRQVATAFAHRLQDWFRDKWAGPRV